MSTRNDANCASASVSARKKKLRIGSSSGLPSTLAVIDLSDESLTKRPRKPPLLRQTLIQEFRRDPPFNVALHSSAIATARRRRWLCFSPLISPPCVLSFPFSSRLKKKYLCKTAIFTLSIFSFLAPTFSQTTINHYPLKLEFKNPQYIKLFSSTNPLLSQIPSPPHEDSAAIYRLSIIL